MSPCGRAKPIELHAIGYKDGKSVGDITGLGNLTWKSSKPDVARMSGSSVIASSLGQSEVTVERKGLTSPARPGDRFQYDRRRTSRRAQGDRDVPGRKPAIGRYRSTSSAVTWTSASRPRPCRRAPAWCGSIRPRGPSMPSGVGAVPLGITMGDKVTRVNVTVRPHAVERRQAGRRTGVADPCPRAGRPLERLPGNARRPEGRRHGRASRWPIRRWRASTRRSDESAP